jgi:hypothetical protein
MAAGAETAPPVIDYTKLGNAVGGGISQYGQGMAAGANQNYMTGATIPTQQNYGSTNIPDTLIPTSGGGNDLAALLQRLLSQGGA